MQETSECNTVIAEPIENKQTTSVTLSDVSELLIKSKTTNSITK